MNKKIGLAVILIFAMLGSLAACSKTKHNWRVVGEATESTPIAFGVHPERGSDSNAQPVYNAVIYYPIGKNEKGVCEFTKIMYELDKLTPEGLDFAFKDLELIAPECLFYDFVIEESNQTESAGPGAPVGTVLNKSGTILYVNDMNGNEVYSSLTNDDEYEGKSGKDLKGEIDIDDVINAMCYTFKENYNLVDCGFVPASEDDYIKKYGSINKNN